MNKKRTRRGKKIRNKLQKFKVWYQNIRGLKSKMDSLLERIEEGKPTVVCITETHLLKSDNLEIEGYKIYRNDRDNFGGGIMIAVSESIKNVCTIVEKENIVGETMWMVVDNTKIKIRIGVVYAPQESRTKKKQYKELYERVEKQIDEARERGQKLMILGDFNCKIGDAIPGNKPEVSKSGKLMKQMVKKQKLSILNSIDVCEGTWTRTEGDSKSIIDYVLMWKEDVKAVQKMRIDEEKEDAPIGYVDGKMTYSDHNVITLKINWVMLEMRTPRMKRKILTKKGEMKYCQQLKEMEVSKIFEKNEDFQDLYRRWKEEVTKIVEDNKSIVKSFNPRKTIRILIKRKKMLKKKAKKSNKNDRAKVVAQIKEVEKEITQERNEQFRNKINKVVAKLQSSNGINGPNMWEVLKKVKRKKEEPAVAIKSKEGKILEEPEDIKTRYLEHFGDLLKQPEPNNEEERRQEEIVECTFKKVLAEAEEKETIFTTLEEVQDAMKFLKKKKSKDGSGWNNEVIMNGGEEMVKSLHKIFNKMEKERVVPEQWNQVIIKAISKPGSVLLMDNKRGLFITDVISKMYERIIKNRNQNKVRQYVSPLQTGGTKGKTTVDHVIVMSEIVRRNRKMGKKTYVVFGDAVKCFDKLWLKDCLLEMHNAGCNLQDIQMMYKLNNETEITVDTPLGKTKKLRVEEIVKQGTVLGPDLCCIETDAINKIGESQERNLGEQIIGILVFVDDVMSAGTAEEIRSAIRNFAEMEKRKKFTYGLKKTKYMIMKTGREKEEKIEENVKEGVVEETDEYKWLGLLLSKEGNLLLHIKNKKKKMKGQVAAMKSLASFSNVGHTFVSVRLNLYEPCIVPSMLYNIEGWTELSKEEITKLESIQLSALCSLLHLPKTTPYLGLLHEVGMWRMQERLMYRKIMLYHNIVNSDDNRLAKKIIEEQEKTNEEGTWYAEVAKHLKTLEIDKGLVKESTKSALKKMVKEKITKRMQCAINTEKKKSSKMRFLNGDELQLRDYIKWGRGNEVLQTIKTRLNMQEIYANYKGNCELPRLCPHCQLEDDTTEHLVECDALGGSNLSRSDLRNDGNTEMWKQLNERIKVNMKWR